MEVHFCKFYPPKYHFLWIETYGQEKGRFGEQFNLRHRELRINREVLSNYCIFGIADNQRALEVLAEWL